MLAFPKRNSPPQDIEKLRESITLDSEGNMAFSPNDTDDPKNWSSARRWFITSICLLMVVNCSFASTAPTGALTGITETFHVSRVAANLVTTLFLSGYCAGPLLWAPISEYWGRRPIFYISFLGYFALTFLCAWAPNFGALLAGRFLTGTFASSSFSNGPGVLADIWAPLDRGNAMGLFIMLTFIGPVVGPITSGFIQLTVGWRWTFYELLWFAAGTILLLPFLPETLPSRRLTAKAGQIRRQVPELQNLRSPQEAKGETLGMILKRSLLRPFRILVDPIAFLITIYNAVVYAVLYMMFTIYPIIFQQIRGWNAGVGELPLIGMAIGAVFGGVGIFLWSGHMQKQSSGDKAWRPEDRLPLAMMGGIILPIAMFWLAWTGAYASVPWIVPTLAGVPLCIGIVWIFVSTNNYLVDSYLTYAASAAAINTVVRSAAAASSPLFTSQMFHALGTGGAGSLLAGVACVLAPIPFLFYRYGEGIRKRSKWAPTGVPLAIPQPESSAKDADPAMPPLEPNQSSHISFPLPETNHER